MKFHFRLSTLLCTLVLSLLMIGFVAGQDAATPEQVVIAGTIQSVLGCDGDWMPECDITALTYDEEDGLWSNEFELPAGNYEYKVALNGSWGENYGANAARDGANIPLVLEADTTVRFVYDHDTHWVADSVNNIIANVPGSYQSEIGCADDWAPWCLQTLLQDADGDGIYTYTTAAIPAGYYEAKVAYNESWDLNYGDGGAQGGANIGFTVPDDGTETVFTYDSTTHVMTIAVGGEVAPAVGNLYLSRGVWVNADTLAWAISRIPGAVYRLHYSPTAELQLTDAGIVGGDSIELTADRAGLPEDVLATNPQLADYVALKIGAEDLPLVPEILQGQLALSVTYNNDSQLGDATGVQIWGVLDDLFANDSPLGVNWDEDIPTVSVWAPTAQNVRLHLFESSDPDAEAHIVDMLRDDATGVWSAEGDADWNGQYYLFEVTVYAPDAGAIVTNLVTDPYSYSLSQNSARSQIVQLDDPALMPEGWPDRNRPDVEAPEDIVLYELHVRDFSANDQSVPEALRGTFAAFTVADSEGMQHLSALADAGLTHIHLLPSFDIATINENAAERQEPDRAQLEALPPDSEEQQAIVSEVRDLDAFNWGYDPYHYTVPEGSYSTDPDSTQRILEFREMVESLNNAGLNVVMDVVYNHTNSSGQNDRSVLDRIVPGYYHRLNADGRVETSTCCQNTATEHAMMQRLMLDSLRTWATEYGVTGFRFDLMGHHMRDNMLEVREMLDSLTLEDDGVNGSQIWVYGEGWDFGEVAGNARGINATQLNMAGTGIGTFNDRLRDAARGGSPFGGWQEQGFVNGLYTYPNEVDTRLDEDLLVLLAHLTDTIRLGMAGNLADYVLVDGQGNTVTGAEVDYNGQPAGYTLDPQENIVYVSAHDNETIFDAIQLKAPLIATAEIRARMQNLANSIVMFSQGVPFFHAGDEWLRSKSLDRNSYNSGDWYNAIDWSGQSNNWGHGLPLEGDNGERWPIMQPLLANPDLAVSPEDIAFSQSIFMEWLQIRQSSPLFRLRTGEDVQQRVTFLNTGTEQIPGVIVMRISDSVGENLDENYSEIVVVINASPDSQTVGGEELTGLAFALHPIQANSVDSVVQDAAFDAESGMFTVPAFTTAVFVVGE
ncbi:MAG: alpha-1,6-glucosidase [Chloroflexi bacterium OLB15]|nr:MAG: alpha-1,6-glucosidase [Chloroflexi bacterium OLB15]